MPKKWNERQNLIIEMYAKDNKTCEQVMKIMRDDYNFIASFVAF